MNRLSPSLVLREKRRRPIIGGKEKREQSPEEAEYLKAQTDEDKIYWTEEMIRTAPKHKSSENFVAELKQRLKKLQEKEEKASKKKSGNKGIRKEGFQFVLVGKKGIFI